MAENLIPIAISSELDITGEERIHVANRGLLVRPTYVAAVISEAFFTYFIGEIFNNVMRVGYSKVDLSTGEHTVLASRDYAGYLGLHSGGVCSNDIDTIFVAGAAEANVLEALQINGSSLDVAATWTGIVAPASTPFNYPIVGLTNEGNTVFVLNESYNESTLQVENLLIAFEFDGTAFNEIGSIAFNPNTGAGNGTQILKFGDYIIVSLNNAPPATDDILVFSFIGDTFTQLGGMSFDESTWTEAPFMSTDGTYIYFAGRPTAPDADTIWAYSVDGAGEFVQEFSATLPEVNDDIEGARVNTTYAVARGYNAPSNGMDLYMYDKVGDAITTPAKYTMQGPLFMPWGLSGSQNIVYAPCGLENLQDAIDEGYWFDEDFPGRNPLRNSGIFDLTKSFEFTSWGSNPIPVAIPDDEGATYAESTITVSGQEGTTCRAAAQVDITHTFYGDLMAYLVAPDGQIAPLMLGNGSATALYDTHYANYPTPTPINGEWKIRIYDQYAVDVGTLNSWEVGIVPGILQSMLNLHIDGEDTYSRLEAGFVTATTELS